MAVHFFNTVKSRLILLVFLAATPAAIGSIVSILQEREFTVDKAKERILAYTRAAITESTENRVSTHQVLLALSNLDEISDINPQACSKILSSIASPDGLFIMLRAVAPDGVTWCSSERDSIGVSVAKTRYFQRAVERRKFSSGDFQIGRVAKEAIHNYSLPAYDEQGNLKFVLVATLSLQPMVENVVNQELPDRTIITLIDPQFKVVARSTDDEWEGRSLVNTDIYRMITGGSDKGVQTIVGLITDKRIHAYTAARRPGGDIQGYVVVSVPEESYLQSFESSIVREVLLLLMIYISVGFIAWIASDLLLMNTLRQLSDTAKRIFQGDYSARTVIADNTEISTLGLVFNEMAAKVESDIAHISTTNRLYELLSEINKLVLRCQKQSELTSGACEVLVKQASYQAVCIYLLDSTGQDLELAACSGADSALFPRKVRLERAAGDGSEDDSSSCTTVLRTGKSLLVDDITALPEGSWHGALANAGVTSALYFPLVYSDQVFGIFKFFVHEKSAFTPLELSFLERICNDIALGLSVIQKDRKLARMNRLYSLLIEINEAADRLVRFPELAMEICRVTVDTGGYFAAAMISLKDSTNPTVMSFHGRGRHALVTKDGAHLKQDSDLRGAVEKLVNERHAVVFNDINSFGNEDTRRSIVEAGIAGLGIFPLYTDGYVSYALILFSDSEYQFPLEDVNILERLSADVSLTLDIAAKDGKVYELSNFDRMTGLANRDLFEDRVAQSLLRSSSSKKFAAAILMRIENHQYLVDSYGWPGGDTAVRICAEALQDATSSSDTIARISEATFGILLHEVSAASDTVNTLNKLLKFIPESVSFNNSDIRIRVIFGIAVYPTDGETSQALIRNAEFALNSVGHDSSFFAYYSPRLDEQAHELQRLESELRYAIKNDELFLVYQPIVAIADRKVTGAEVLLRWKNSVFGLVSPEKFIPLAEKYGLMPEIGAWVFENACHQLRNWPELSEAGFTLSINVSVAQLRQPGYLDQLVMTLYHTGVDPKKTKLSIEITESELMNDITHTMPMLKKIREMGITLSIDDFGTGYSSMSYLRSLPVNTLKIDLSFIRDILHDENARIIVKSTIALAHNLQLQVVAEGVEEEAQLDLLAELGCDYAQGYLFSKPAVAAEFRSGIDRLATVDPDELSQWEQE